MQRLPWHLSLPQPSYHKLQQYAIAISIASIIYNGFEGGISIGFGSEADSHSLVFFGIQSGIEVISSILVVWRFWCVALPGEEGRAAGGVSGRELRIERTATTCISLLLLLLSLGTLTTSTISLTTHTHPTTSLTSLIISSSALTLMILIYLPKRYLAKKLNSSSMQAEAQCSLSCIEITGVLFVGSLVYRVWEGGWWVDGATCVGLGVGFGWDGWKMCRWARSREFDGGCCGGCRPGKVTVDVDVELGKERYRDLCECCSEKEECKSSDVCQCSISSTEVKSCCVPINKEGSKCCSHDYITSPSLRANACQDSCCTQAIAVTPDPTTEACKEQCCSTPTPNIGVIPVEPDNKECELDCCTPAIATVPAAAAVPAIVHANATTATATLGSLSSPSSLSTTSFSITPGHLDLDPRVSTITITTARAGEEEEEEGCSCCD